MENYFDNNKAVLLENNKYLSWFLNDIFLQPYPVVKAKNGELTCYASNRWICSRYSPLEEAKKFVSSQSLSQGDMVVLYGFGLGYHIKPILDNIGEKGFLYCLETNTRLLKTALSANDFSEIFSDKRLKIITGSNSDDIAVAFDHYILWNLENFPSEKIKVVIHEPSLALIPEEFSWVQNSLEIIKFERRGDSYFYDEIKENIKNNMDTVLNSPGVDDLSKVFGNYPVIFVGAGPSLDKCINLLSENKNNAFIVCVDTAVIPLYEHNIKPDIIISVDPQDKSFDNFFPYENELNPLIILPSSSKKVVEKVKGSKIIAIQKGSFFSEFFSNRLDHLGLSYGGGAVSVLGVDVVLKRSNGPVILMGMDFSFPHLKSYADYTPEFNNWHKKSGPYHTLEMASIENIFSRKFVFVDNYMGEKIPTFQSMYSYLRSLETVIEYHKKENNIYILYPDGAKIKGVIPLLFDEELKQILRYPVLKKIELKVPLHSKELIDFCQQKVNELD